MGFPTKNDHFGVFWGYHHLRKHPYGEPLFWISPLLYIHHKNSAWRRRLLPVHTPGCWLLFPKEVSSHLGSHNSFLPLEIPDHGPTLPEINSEFTPENWWDWKTIVFFWVSVTFLGTMLVSGRENHQHTGRVVPWGSRTKPTRLSLLLRRTGTSQNTCFFPGNVLKTKVGCRAATFSDNHLVKMLLIRISTCPP